MSTKFDLLIDFDLLKAAISTDAKPEIVLLRFGRYIALSSWRPRPLKTISGFAFVDIAEIYFRFRVLSIIIGPPCICKVQVSNPIQCDVTGAGSPLCPHLK